MKKFLINSAKYIVIIFVLGNLVGFLANHFLRKSQFYKSSFLINGFDKNKRWDYFVTGSSRGLTTLNTNLIDEKLNTVGINLSMDDTDLKTQFLMIKHFFESGYSSKNCILVLDDNHFITTNLKLGNNDYRFVPFSFKPYVNEHFKKYEKSKMNILQHSHANPFFTYSYYNLELLLPAFLSAIKPSFRNKFDIKGNYSYPNNKKIQIKEIKQKTSEITNPLIIQINNYLIKNNCKLIVYIAPYANLSYKIKNMNRYRLVNHSGLIVDQEKLFFDDIHVNREGRKEATNKFIAEIKHTL